MTLITLPPWCPCSILSPPQLKGCCCYEACLTPAIAFSFWAGTSCLRGTFLPPPSLQRAISPRATGILGGGCHATAPPSTLMGRKSIPQENAGPVLCATWGCDHDTMWVTVTVTARYHEGEGCKPLLSCHGASGGLSLPTLPWCLLQAGGSIPISL